MENKIKLLITGSRGFLGKRLCCALEKKGYLIEHFDIVDGLDIKNPEQVDEYVKK